MPTGYTSAIYEGENVSVQDYILKCARAFGATIMMKEESLDKEIPGRFEPDQFYKKRVDEKIKELQRIKGLTKEEIENEIKNNHDYILKANRERKEKNEILKNRYENMIAEVNKWEAPADHNNLKKFCLEQLEYSLKCDVSESYYDEEIAKESTDEWLNRNIERCERDIKYYTDEWIKEVKRVEERNLWIKQLRDSIKNL